MKCYYYIQLDSFVYETTKPDVILNEIGVIDCQKLDEDVCDRLTLDIKLNIKSNGYSIINAEIVGVA